MKQYKLFLIVLWSIFLIQKKSYSQFTGIYANYEQNVTLNMVLEQYVKSNDFRETYNAELASYPIIKLGVSKSFFTYFAENPGRACGIDFGAGILYAKSTLNALDEFNPQSSVLDFFQKNFFKSTPSNYATFFNYYQTGNIAHLTDYGINAHVDMGTLIYIGGEIDAGVSRLVFTDSEVRTQSVRSTGWFAIPRVQLGLSFPLPLYTEYESYLLNLKFYASYGWNYRTNSMNWKSHDKKLNNFSRINSTGNPIGIGFSLTIGLPDSNLF